MTPRWFAAAVLGMALIAALALVAVPAVRAPGWVWAMDVAAAALR